MTLTKKQQRVLDAIRFLIGKGESPTVREIGALVGLRSTSTVQKHLDSLEAAGVIERRGRLSRGIRLVQAAGPSDGDAALTGDFTHEEAGPANTGAIPLVGRIAAGHPLEASEDAEAGLVDMPSDVSSKNASDGSPSLGVGYGAGFTEVGVDASVFVPGAEPGSLVALRVVGESMIDCGILDGDIVIIRRQATVEEGEVAAVTVDGAGTLKRWRRPRASAESGSIPDSRPVQLHPGNERFPVIEIRAEDGQDVRVYGKYVGLVRGARV